MRRFNTLQEYFEPAIVVAQEESERVVVLLKKAGIEHVALYEPAQDAQ